MTAPFDNDSARPEDWLRNQQRDWVPPQVDSNTGQRWDRIPPSQHLLLPQEMQPSVGLIPTEFFSTTERVLIMLTCLLASTASALFIYTVIQVLMFFGQLQEKMDNWNNLLN